MAKRGNNGPAEKLGETRESEVIWDVSYNNNIHKLWMKLDTHIAVDINREIDMDIVKEYG